MSLADRASMSAQQFLDWVERQPDGRRYELLAGQPIEMAAERNRHNLVKTACGRALEDAVDAAGLDCAVLGDGASVIVGDDDVFGPDAVVQCGEPVDVDATVVPHPTILVEVLSPSTQGVDAGGKLYGYLQLPSVRHYLIVDPVKLVVVHHRKGDDGIATALLREGRLSLDPPGIDIEVADCFASLRRELTRR